MPSNPRQTLHNLIVAVDAEGIELARGEVRPEDVPQLCAFYWRLDSWPRRLALVELLRDHYHPAMDKICLDVLRAPNDGVDWVDLPKIAALRVLTGDRKSSQRYFGDRAALRRAVDDMLEEHGLERDTAVSANQTKTPIPKRDYFASLIAGREREVLEHLADGADVNARQDNRYDGMPAIAWAARQGMHEAVAVMISRGADVDAADQHGSTALMQAAIAGHLEIVHALLAAGADPNRTDSRGMAAAAQTRSDAIRALLVGQAPDDA